MRIYATYTLEQAKGSKGYDARMAERMLDGFRYVKCSFACRGDGSRLRPAEPGEIIYIKATGGKYGKGASMLNGGHSIISQVADKLIGKL